MRRLVIALLAAATVLVPATAFAGPAYPDHIDLPDGFRPEGIAVGRGHTFYAGSLADGAIYRGDLRTGIGDVLVAGEEGRISVGLSVDNNEQLFVAGGDTGQAYVYDGRTGDELAVLSLGVPDASFINDIVATRTAAWFTDSFNPVLYRVPIGPNGAVGTPVALPLSGDYTHVSGFNVNGIDATPDGMKLVIVQSSTGKLFVVDPMTADADEIDLGGDTVPNGDGIVLDGKTLYVVQNFINRVARVDLAPDLSSGVVAGFATDPDFDIPTTAAGFGTDLYLVNARFSTPPTPDTGYWITRIDKP